MPVFIPVLFPFTYSLMCYNISIMIMKKQFFAPAIFGLVLGLTFTAAAFNEPTAGPTSLTSEAPVNVGAETQYRDGSLGIGDGSNAPSTSYLTDNSMYFESNLGLDSVTVRQNALLASNVTVGGRTVVSGLLRVGQLIPSGTNSSSNGYGISHPNIKNGYDLYMPAGSTTNLINGYTCKLKSANAACPNGYVLINIDPSGSNGVYGVCRGISPVVGTNASPTSKGDC